MNKTAMQEWFDELKANYPYMANEIYKKGFDKYLEKEKEQIIEAGNACGLKSTVYHLKLSEMSKDELEQELVKDDMTHGEEYYNQTYNQNK